MKTFRSGLNEIESVKEIIKSKYLQWFGCIMRCRKSEFLEEEKERWPMVKPQTRWKIQTQNEMQAKKRD